MNKIVFRLLIVLLTLPLLSIPKQTIKAQSANGQWSNFVNISKTPTASIYPCIAGDTAGNVHVLWVEDVGGKAKNLLTNPDGSPQLDSYGHQINYLTDAGNTLFYTRWDGKNWLDPIDIQFNPIGKINYPEAAIDYRGVLHVIWVATQGENTQLLYSKVIANYANLASAWSTPIVIAEPVLFAYYPMDIAIDSLGGVHILYFKTGLSPGAYEINSYDGGNNWIDPVLLYSTSDEKGEQEGASPLRLVIDKKDRLHATWTLYGADGRGKAIFYSQSLDRGRTWSEPYDVADWQPGWYEVNWLSVGVVGDEIHLVWEGNSQVASQAERISNDGGLSWNPTHLILPSLVGENGFADLLTDSANQLELLVVKRADPGALSNGVWYTAWSNDHWQDPILLTGTNSSLSSTTIQNNSQSLQHILENTMTGNGLRYQRSVIVNGNELHVIVVNEWDGDIWESHTTLLDAPFIPPKPYPKPTDFPTQLPSTTPEISYTSTPESLPLTKIQVVQTENPLTVILLSISPALLLILGVAAYLRFFKRN